MSIFRGSAVAIITPFNENKSINFEEFGRIIDNQIDNGTNAIVVCGTTGEASTMTHEEHLECISFATAHVRKRVPVIAGTGSNCTDTAIYLSKEAEKRGADAVLVVSPYYNKATQKGLITHFTDVAASIDIPMILYNIPGRTGCNILPETIAELAANVDNIVAVKDSTDNFDQIARMMNLCEGRIDLYSGNDSQVLPMLALGGIGVISVLAHLVPREVHDMVANFLNGNVNEAIRAQVKYIPLISALFCEVNPIPVKKAMQMMGYATEVLRKPLTEMEPAHSEILAEEMRKLNII